jgi:hypothetical protein
MGVKSIQTIDVGDLNAVMPQHGRNHQKAHGLGPKVVSSEIVDPGIDE